LKLFNFSKMSIYQIILIFVLIILLVGVLIYFFQEKFFFHPEKLPFDFNFEYENLVATEKMVETEPGAMIDYLHFKTEKPLQGLVFYLKGNTKSIKGWGKFAIDFTRLGFDVIMLDYRGFGKSTGRRSSDAMKRDIQAIYNEAKKEYDENEIIVYGRSLGSGYASMLAAKNRPKMLILASPVYSLISTVRRYLPFMPARPFMRYNIPTHKYLKAVTCPVKIIHGSNDNLIPLKSVVSLSNVNPEKTRLYIILGAGHINIHQYEDYHRIMEEILIGKNIEIHKEETSLGFSHRK
jgi:pimeloyl-ACP methyl ester carboxylesterase